LVLTTHRAPKGPPKNKVGDPRGGWVDQRRKKGQGQFYVFDIFLMIFLNSPHRETLENVIKQNFGEKIGFGFLVEFFAKTSRHEFSGSVFEHPSLSNTRNRDETKKVEEELTSKCCFGKSFRHGLFVKTFAWCF
jgi:hypothetical protein